jgi:beta-glucosidase
MKKFPDNFLWGTSISSYQTEGNNMNSDWWKWEESGKTTDRSGKACEYWENYNAYHDLLDDLGCGTFRLSIEWSRVEPREGEFDAYAIHHYRELLKDLRRRNIKTIVTLWHWTSPIWFEEKYGFHRRSSVAVFERYATRIVEELGDVIDIYVVLNEPMVPLGEGYLTGKFPPGYKSLWKFWRAHCHLATSHKKAYNAIHKAYPDALVGISYLYNWYDAPGGSFLERVAERVALWFRVDWLARKIRHHQDYFGLDYYRLGRIRRDTKNSTYLGFRIEDDPHNPMGWVEYPIGIYKTLKQAHAKYKLPIYIMENGVPTDEGLDDEKRSNFMREHLRFVARAIEEGVDVKGYNYWALMDNYEWLGGFQFKFGLVKIDYATMERLPRKSFDYYKEVIEKNQI